MAAVLSGLLVGVLFGFALQRGRFCMNSAFRDIVVVREFTLFKAVAVAILVEMIGFAILSLTGVITLAPKPFMWGANIVGGLVFGFGMVLAGGCASGITYRTGEGMVGAMVAVAGFGLGGLMTSMGVLNPVAAFLQNTKVMAADEKPLTLANILGLPLDIVMLVLAGVIIVIWVIIALTRKSDEGTGENPKSLGEAIFKHGWGWLATGIVVGLIGILAFPLSAAAGRNYPLGITGGWIGLWKSLIIPDTPLGWEPASIIGIVVGALVAALIAGEFAIRAPAPKIIVQTFFGGLLMSFGAVVSGGCNIGHILSGVPQLSIGSIVGGVSIILGGWIMAYFMFIRPMRA